MKVYFISKIRDLTSQISIENLLSILLYALQRENRKIIPETIIVSQKTIHNRIPANPPETMLTHIPMNAMTSKIKWMVKINMYVVISFKDCNLQLL